MRWSQLRKRVRERFSDEMSKRVDLAVDRFRKAHDEVGELRITLDGEKIYSASFLAFQSRMAASQENLHYVAAENNLYREGIISDGYLQRLLEESLSHSIDEMLESKHPAIRAIAVVDARFGKRRARQFPIAAEAVVVRRLYQARFPPIEQKP